MSRRRDGSASSGWVRWPTHLTSTGEGGMFVYAIVPSLDRDDPFEVCCGVASAELRRREVLVPEPGQGNNPERRWWPRGRGGSSVDLLAAVCLGSTGGSWYTGDLALLNGRMWTATYADLTEEGQALVRALMDLYGRPVHLLTFLDT